MKPKKCNVTRQAARVLKILGETYPEAHCELNFSGPFQLLVATMLSAQSTDKKVNEVTKILFEKYPDPQSFLALSQTELELEIKQIGLFRNKAKNILAVCRLLLEKYQGHVPKTMDELLQLPGVGRKTANVVMANAFGIPTIAVDTHVFRVANRLGLACSEDICQVENQLMEAVPKDQWIQAHHWLIWHGRRVCEARNPKCYHCPLQECCRFKLAAGVTS